MTTLTIECTGDIEQMIETLVKRGYCKTKTEAVRTLLAYGAKTWRVMDDRDRWIEEKVYADYKEGVNRHVP